MVGTVRGSDNEYSTIKLNILSLRSLLFYHYIYNQCTLAVVVADL